MTPGRMKLAIMIGAGVVVVGVVVGVLAIARAAPLVIVAFVAFGLLVYLALRIRANRRTKVVFGFYGAANEILLNGERSRYHFEIAEVIKTGERIVKSMPDSPPLARFSLGALYHSIGDHNAAAEQLGFAAEEEVLKDSRHLAPSRQLRRYVERLRKIERRPRRHARLNAAIANLEMMHRERGARLLAESQQQLKRMVEAYEGELTTQAHSPRKDVAISSSRSLKSITAPPPISEVLNDIYQEDRKTS